MATAQEIRWPTSLEQCSCGRLMNRVHCPDCGVSNTYVCRRDGRHQFVAEREYVVLCYKCRGCGCIFYADTKCAAPPPLRGQPRMKSQLDKDVDLRMKTATPAEKKLLNAKRQALMNAIASGKLDEAIAQRKQQEEQDNQPKLARSQNDALTNEAGPGGFSDVSDDPFFRRD